jgi:hypothetical protein
MPADSTPMSAAAPLIASGVQGGGAHPPPDETLLVAMLIAALTAVCALIVRYLRRRSHRAKPVTDQWEAAARMGELCPDGWQAQITLYGWGAPVPPDAPAARTPLVELEWQQFAPEPGRVIVSRTLWAPTIVEALQLMVQDRQTDLTLEEIEQAAGEDDGAAWPD